MQESIRQIERQAAKVAEQIAVIVEEGRTLRDLEAEAETREGLNLVLAGEEGKQARRYSRAAGALEDLEALSRSLRTDLRQKSQGCTLAQADWLRAFADAKR